MMDVSSTCTISFMDAHKMIGKHKKGVNAAQGYYTMTEHIVLLKGERNQESFSPTICVTPQAAEPSLLFSREEEKRRFCLNHVRPLKSPKPNFWANQACTLLSIWFSKCEHSFIDKLIVTTEPTLLLLLGLGSKLHPSKKQQMYHLSSSTPQSR